MIILLKSAFYLITIAKAIKSSVKALPFLSCWLHQSVLRKKEKLKIIYELFQICFITYRILLSEAFTIYSPCLGESFVFSEGSELSAYCTLIRQGTSLCSESDVVLLPNMES